jgi:site-specific recombinase XerC
MEAGDRQSALPEPDAVLKYLFEEGEIRANPMANMKPPKVPEEQVPAINDADLTKLLAACDGKHFDDPARSRSPGSAGYPTRLCPAVS